MIVAVPAIALCAALWCAIPRSGRAAPLVTVAGSFVTFAISGWILWSLRLGGTVVTAVGWIEMDSLGAVLLALIAFVYFTASLFSWGYLNADDGRRLRQYHANFNLFAFSMLSIPCLSELGLVWIFVELTTLLSVLLVSYEQTAEAVEAAWKYMVLTLIGATVAVLGVLILFWALHTAGSTDFTWSGLRMHAAALPRPLVEVAFVLLLVGYGAKIGLVPLHAWLPDAHSQAPSPVCAMLSGVETTAVLYVILRLRDVFASDPSLHVGIWFSVVGLTSVGVASFLILQAHDYKRLFAFSTVEHMGLILTAASIFTPAGDIATVWQMLAHSLAKSLCFYAAGAVLVIAGTREIANVRGLLAESPTTAGAFLFGALAIGGAPPMVVFWSALQARLYAVAVLLTLFIVLAFFGLLWRVTTMIGGEHRLPGRRLPAACALAIAVAAIPVIVFGVWLPGGIYDALRSAGQALGAL